ncbi:MAG: anti-phage defense ZorAB system ZorA [SAR324 cluster bacterium]|nr:anti-phage defense ZorAB system ZorA [SAR324 cluster bacterium]
MIDFLLEAWANPIPQIVIIVVMILLLVFLIFYFFRAIRLKWLLWNTEKSIRVLRHEAKGECVLPKDLTPIMSKSATLKHLWSEYQETLHHQKDGRVRATVGAENFFHTESLVDIPLFTDFFKHLPGILTGIGIIGTFWGLIQGLHGFQPGGEPEAVRQSLQFLLNGVREAFIASGIAIFMAMIITFFEKISLASCYSAVEKLAQIIDALYESGVGEEYLSELVSQSTKNATQTTQLKDVLVEELKQLLTNLTERQIQANQSYYQESSQTIASQIQESIQSGMQPLGRIATAVDGVRKDQGSAVHGMLEDVLTAFMSKMEDTFGGQMTGLNSMMTESVQAMQNMQQGFSRLITDLEKSGANNTSVMSNELRQIMNESENRQNQMNHQMKQLVEEIGKISSGNTSTMGSHFSDMMTGIEIQQKQIGLQMQEWIASISNTANKSQSEMIEQLGTSMNALSQQMQTVLTDFSKQRESALSQEREHQTQTRETTQKLLEDMTHHLNASVKDLSEQMKTIMIDFSSQRKSLVEAEKVMQSQLIGNTQEAIGSLKENMETHQTQIERQQQTWLAQMTSSMENSQSRMTENLNGAIGELFHQMQAILNDFSQQRKSALSEDQKHQEKNHQTYQKIVNGMELGIEKLVVQVDRIMQGVKENTQSINQVTQDTVSRMNQGADKLFIAANEFNQAGKSVQGVMTTANEVYGKLSATGTTLDQSTKVLQSVMQDYTQARSEITRMVALMKDLVENAKKETGMNHQIVSDMQKVSQKLSEVQEQTNDYLNQVSGVLTTSFNAFGDSVEKSLVKSKAEFDSSLSNAVKMLNSTIEELGSTVDTVIEIGNKLKH